MKSFRGYFGYARNDEDCPKNPCTNEVADIHGHGHGIAAGLSKRCGKYLDDPEDQSYLWHFA